MLCNAAVRGREVSVLSNNSYLSFRIHCLPAAIILGETWLLKNNTYHAYTGCNRRNGPDFGRVFLMLNYTENPQNTYIQS